jgi:hypothetical protein
MEQILPPEMPSTSFSSRKDMISFIQAHGKTNGFAVTIHRSKPRNVILQCDRGGNYKSIYKNKPESRIRKNACYTRRCGCPFKIFGKCDDSGFWSFIVSDPSHNHEPSLAPTAHPMHRRLNEAQIKTIDNLTRAGNSASVILSSLKGEGDDVPIITKDISNAKLHLKLMRQSSRSPMETLMDELIARRYPHEFSVDDGGVLNGFAFALPSSIALTKRFGSSLIMDCTYKTNKYQMPVHHIVGSTCCNTTFTSAFIFLNSETTESYIWALEAYRRLIPGKYLIMFRSITHSL